MPDLWMDVDIALSEVPVNVMPLLDDTDFKSRETSVAYNAAGMDLVWNFVTTGGAFTQTAVTPTTAGDYDWTHQGDGMYTIEIPASGGASINNDTEGFGWFTGLVTGVLPWRGPTIGFRAAALNNLLIDDALSATRGLAGTALPDAAAEAAGGLYTRGTGAGQINQAANGMIDTNPVRLNNVSQSLLDLKDLVDDGYDPATNKLQGVVLVDTLTTYTGNTPQTGDAYARLGAPAGASVSADIADVEGKVDDLESRLGTPSDLGSGATVAANLVDIEAQTDDIGIAGAGLTNVPWNAAWDAEVESEVTDALNAYDPPTRAELTSDTNSVLSAISTVAGYIDTEVTTLLNRIGAFTGTGVNTILGFFQSLMRKDATTPTDLGGAYDDATDSLEAIRDRGDSAWITATGFSTLTQGDIRTAVGLASANLDTQLSTIAGYIDTEITTLITNVATILAAVDTEVGAIKAKTDNLPADPADASDIATSFSSIASTLTTIAAYLDTEIASILADTNELQTDWVDGGRLDLILDARASQASLDTLDNYVDTEVAAIKGVTDKLDTTLELDGPVYRFTTNALEQAPAGGGGGGTGLINFVYGGEWVLNQQNRIDFFLQDSAGLAVTGLGSGYTLTLAKNGAALAASAGTKAEIGSGWYTYLATAGEADTIGTIAVKVVGAGAVDQPLEYVVKQRTAGAIPFTYTVTNSVTTFPEAGVAVWITTDIAGANIIWVGTTDALGVAKDSGGSLPYLDIGSYYFWKQKSGFVDAQNPDQETVS